MTGMWAAALVATLFILLLHTSTPFHAPPLPLNLPATSLVQRSHAGRVGCFPIFMSAPAGAAQIRAWRATGWLDRVVDRGGAGALGMCAGGSAAEGGVALEEDLDMDAGYLLPDEDEEEEEEEEGTEEIVDLTGDGGGKDVNASGTPAPLPAGPVPVREFRAVAGVSSEGKTKLRLVSYNVLGPKQVRLSTSKGKF